MPRPPPCCLPPAPGSLPAAPGAGSGRGCPCRPGSISTPGTFAAPRRGPAGAPGRRRGRPACSFAHLVRIALQLLGAILGEFGHLLETVLGRGGRQRRAQVDRARHPPRRMELAQVGHLGVDPARQRVGTVHVPLDDRCPVVGQVPRQLHLLPAVVDRDRREQDERVLVATTFLCSLLDRTSELTYTTTPAKAWRSVVSRISLASYALRFRESRSREFLQLGDLPKSLSALEVVTKFLEDLQSEVRRQDQSQSLLRVSRLEHTEQTSELAGLIETGGWGFESDILNIDTGSLAHHRDSREAELLPFYFLASLPPDRDEGVVLLQRFGAAGVKTAFSAALKQLLEDVGLDVQIEMRHLLPSAMVDEWLDDGHVKAVRFVQFGFPPDLADQVDLEDHVEGVTEIVLKAKRGERFLSRHVRHWLDRGLQGKILELAGLDVEASTVKLEVDLNNRRRVFDVSNMGRMRAYHDVSEQVAMDDSGHPRFESLDSVARELLADLKEELYGGGL